MWCGAAEHTGMPSSSEQDDWGACTFFGTVPLLPLARVDGYGVAQPCLAAVIEGDQRHCNSEAYATSSDLSRSSTLSGQRSNTDERLGLKISVGATSRSGATEPTHAGVGGVNLGNPCAEKVSAHRFRQSSAPVGHRQGMLTITGSNVRLGTEMPVALSYF
jgi:hypothetical protein